MNDDTSSKYLRFTLTMRCINKDSRDDVKDFFYDLVDDIVSRPSFYHCGFWLKQTTLMITAEYYQCAMKSIYMKLVNNRLAILKESYGDTLKISFVIEEVEPDFSKIIPEQDDDAPVPTPKTTWVNDAYTREYVREEKLKKQKHNKKRYEKRPKDNK